MKKHSAYLARILIVFLLLASLWVILVNSVSASPTGSILINEGASHTTTNNVTLTLSYADNVSKVSKVRYSNDGSTWSGWEDPSPTKAWNLTSGDGTKTVYFRIRNQANQVSPTYSDTIILDI